MPIVAGAFLLLLLVRPTVFGRPFRLLDASLAACLVAIAAQVVPVTEGARRALSPSAFTVEQELVFDPGAHTTLSLDPAATAWSLSLAVALLLVFWSSRALFTQGAALRLVARWTAWSGLALAAVMFVQRAATPGLIYGFWAPVTRSSRPTPLGPFVNRNDIATWFLLACPLAFGYLVARLSASSVESGRRRDVESMADSRTVWLAGSVCLMTAALMASLSRSGLFGGATAVFVFALAARRRVTGRRLGLGLIAVGGLVAAATAYVNLDALARRLNDTLPSNFGGRLDVWRETWPMARDFLMTGVGVGAFERGMLVYQQSTRLIFFNHAHNEYLQLLVEGGLLVGLPAAMAVVAGWRGVRARLASDTTPMYWIRTGAASGLAAVAAQGVWNTGLRMPASGVLFAIVAAAALYDDSGAEDRAAGYG